MKKTNSIKNVYKSLLVIAAILCINNVHGQSTVTIGTGTSSSYLYGPYYRSSSSSSFNYSRYAYVYSASELNIPPNSLIIKVEWNKKSGTMSGNNVFDIYMNNTSTSSLSSGTSWGTVSAGATKVYSSTTQSFGTGWIPFTMDVPFLYTGGNLLLLTNHRKLGSASAANNFYYTTATGKAIGYASSAAPSNSSSLSTTYGNRRPNIKITWVPACAVDIVSSPSDISVCAGDSVMFTAQVDDAQQYIWQENDGNGWQDLQNDSRYSGVNTENLKISNIAANMDDYLYRIVATNTSENCSLTSDSAMVDIVPIPATSVRISASPNNTLCKDEEVTVYTYTVNEGSSPVYKWFKNGVEIPGAKNATYQSTDLKNGDEIYSTMKSGLQCAIPVTSNKTKFTINDSLKTGVNVTVSFEGNSTYRFTATPANGGTNPEYYWYVNGNMQQNERGQSFVTDALQPYDDVYVKMKTSMPCAFPEIATSEMKATGISNTTASQTKMFSLSPNPNSGSFILKNINVEGKVTVAVQNLFGQNVYTATHMVDGDHSVSVQVPDLSSGMYIVNVTSGNKTAITRMIVE